MYRSVSLGWESLFRYSEGRWLAWRLRNHLTTSMAVLQIPLGTDVPFLKLEWGYLPVQMYHLCPLPDQLGWRQYPITTVSLERMSDLHVYESTQPCHRFRSRLSPLGLPISLQSTILLQLGRLANITTGEGCRSTKFPQGLEKWGFADQMHTSMWVPWEYWVR